METKRESSITMLCRSCLIHGIYGDYYKGIWNHRMWFLWVFFFCVQMWLSAQPLSSCQGLTSHMIFCRLFNEMKMPSIWKRCHYAEQNGKNVNIGNSNNRTMNLDENENKFKSKERTRIPINDGSLNFLWHDYSRISFHFTWLF